MRKKRGTDYYVNRHSCFLLQYHLVLVTKTKGWKLSPVGVQRKASADL